MAPRTGGRCAARALRPHDPLAEPLNCSTGEREAIVRACNANRHAHSMANFIDCPALWVYSTP